MGFNLVKMKVMGFQISIYTLSYEPKTRGDKLRELSKCLESRANHERGTHVAASSAT